MVDARVVDAMASASKSSKLNFEFKQTITYLREPTQCSKAECVDPFGLHNGKWIITTSGIVLYSYAVMNDESNDRTIR